MSVQIINYKWYCILETQETLMRKKWSDSEKARIALLAFKEEKTIAEISQETGAHPAMISKWKKELLENADSVFRNGKTEREKELEKEQDELYKQLGKLHAGNDMLKKKLKEWGV